MDTLLGLLALPLLFGLPLAYVWLQMRLLFRWAGPWRVAAALPLVGGAVWGGNFASDISEDPTSHNLFPLEVLIGAGLATLYLGAIALARWLVRIR